MAEVSFVSTNRGKYLEAVEILARFGHRVRWVRRKLPEPQADNLREVALAKLGAVSGLPGTVLVEDSGLFIPALNGFPGIYSAHILEIWGFDPILELMRRRPRAAEFRSVAAVRRGRTTRTFSGTVNGTIARAARGIHGFGFDPIFVPRGERSTFGELPTESKNLLSHRARSMERVGRYLAARRHGESR